MTEHRTIVLRLAAPLQSWGIHSQFNRRETASEPTRSGVIGLLAAAQGRRREDPIADLLTLRLGVRTDQPGNLLRDYHTVSDYRDRPLPTTEVDAKGRQRRKGKPKVTERFYLSDAVFVAALEGPAPLLSALADAVRHPAFPLALGRRACAPTQPLLVTPDDGTVWETDLDTTLRAVPWIASAAWRRARRQRLGPTITLPVTVDDPDGDHTATDTPVSFAPKDRGFVDRRVRHDWVTVPTGLDGADDRADTHDPFALLGW